jgi:two-component system, response regulator / RNA-binding antiterminator
VNSSLSILIIDENLDRASLIEDGLREAGHDRVVVVDRVHGILKRIEEERPDVIVIDLANAGRDLLEHMFLISRAVRKPIAMFVDKSDEQSMYQAIEAGVSAYVVDGLKKDRVKSVLDLAVIRFKAFEKLRAERDGATQALIERKAIDRAKGILMKLRNVGEEDAYRLLRKAAMDQKKTVADIASAVVASSRIMLEPRDG